MKTNRKAKSFTKWSFPQLRRRSGWIGLQCKPTTLLPFLCIRIGSPITLLERISTLQFQKTEKSIRWYLFYHFASAQKEIQGKFLLSSLSIFQLFKFQYTDQLIWSLLSLYKVSEKSMPESWQSWIHVAEDSMKRIEKIGYS